MFVENYIGIAVGLALIVICISLFLNNPKSKKKDKPKL